jgi:proline iminopeptidase
MASALAGLLLLASSGWVHGQTTGYAPGDGVDLHYTTFGTGAPLLVLNGGPGFPSRHFYPLAESLAIGRQVVLFDQRGTGRSPLSSVNDSTVTVAAMVEDIEAVRRHLGIERWTVMGHSWGGMYAMLYAARHPTRVDALMLSASGGINLDFTRGFSDRLRAPLTEAERAALDRWSDPDRIAENPEQARRARTRAMAPAYVYHREHVPTVVRMLTEESGFEPAVNQLVWADLRRMEYDLSTSMRGFQKPVLVVHGRDDFLGEAVPRDIHAAFPRSRLVLIDDCRHYLWLDQPDRYFATLRTFLADTKNRRSPNP